LSGIIHIRFYFRKYLLGKILYYIRGSLKVSLLTEKMRSNRLAWYGHVMRTMSMNVDGHPRRGRPKKRWMDNMKDDMRIKGVSMEMTSDRREWKKTCRADPT
jgi:hypothetical protein